MAIICKKYKMIFIMTPRTGCTAIGKVLEKEFGGVYLPEMDIVDDSGYFKIQKKHCTLKQLLKNNLISNEELKDYFVFTTVRNHFDSLYSLYMKQKVKYLPLLQDKNSWVFKVPNYVDTMLYCQKHDINEWVKYNYSIPAYKRILNRGRLNMYSEFVYGVDYVMKYEKLQKEFDKVISKIGVKRYIDIPKVNETEVKMHKSYREAYNRKSRKILEYVFENELEKYDYNF